MITTCLMTNAKKCVKRDIIRSFKEKPIINIVYGYQWNTASDNTALIYEAVQDVAKQVKLKYPVDINFESLGGKEGSIYCSICQQIQKADIALFDISTHNLNVVLEAGLAIGSGAYVFLLRSWHYKQPEKTISDLNGILEYRFTRRNGRLSFDSNFNNILDKKLTYLAKNKLKTAINQNS